MVCVRSCLVGWGRVDPSTWCILTDLKALFPSDLHAPSHNDLPQVLRQRYKNVLQDVNLRNFSHSQTSLDRLRDGLVGAQVPQGHTGCHSMAAGGCWGHRNLDRPASG